LRQFISSVLFGKSGSNSAELAGEVQSSSAIANGIIPLISPKKQPPATVFATVSFKGDV
jgi:hypothetical protein